MAAILRRTTGPKAALFLCSVRPRNADSASQLAVQCGLEQLFGGPLLYYPQWRLHCFSGYSDTKDIQKPGDYGGFSAVPINEWRWQIANLRILSKKDGDRG